MKLQCAAKPSIRKANDIDDAVENESPEFIMTTQRSEKLRCSGSCRWRRLSSALKPPSLEIRPSRNLALLLALRKLRCPFENEDLGQT